MILFLGLRAEEPEELYHRNPVFERARIRDASGSSPVTREIVIFVLHKYRLSSTKSANADATPSPCAARPAQAGRRYQGQTLRLSRQVPADSFCGKA